MNKGLKSIGILNIIIILLSVIVAVCGICSFQTGQFYETVNQYGETIKMWGAGIYTHDSYFKAPINIGSDFTILVAVLPLAVVAFLKMRAKPVAESYIQNFGVTSLLLYYSASIAFGVTYNRLHLLYIALFAACFYCTSLLFVKLYTLECNEKKVCKYRITKGMKVFLIISGIALTVAWFPDIVASLVSGTSLNLIEVYTTEITYVLDMGILSPLMFLTLYLLNKENFVGYVLFRMILKVCAGMGIMITAQSVFQMMAGVSVPIPALITKGLVFLVLALSAVIFDRRLKQETRYIKE